MANLFSLLARRLQFAVAGREDFLVPAGELVGRCDVADGAVQPDGSLKAPATDEVFMREHMKEWKRLMSTEPKIHVVR